MEICCSYHRDDNISSIKSDGDWCQVRSHNEPEDLSYIIHFCCSFLKIKLFHPPLSLSLFSWRVAALFLSIKHVCVHTLGASLHADFADSRNKFRGPSVREVGVLFLPPHWGYKLISVTGGTKQPHQTAGYVLGCSIQEQDYCHGGAFYSGIILSALQV